MGNSLEFNPQVRAQVQQVAIGWFSSDASAKTAAIHGPALIYTGWNGASCGTSHNLPAIAQAAAKLGIPLYVISGNALSGNPREALSADKPGIRINANTANELIETLSNYDLLIQDRHIRLIGADGKITGPQDVVSAKGSDAIVAAFAGPVAQICRATHAASCERNGR